MRFKIHHLFFLLCLTSVLNAQNLVIIVIDGARYTETFGDPDKTYIPNMAELALEGTYCDEIYYNHFTYTSEAIPALWTGSWAGTRDTLYNGNSTQYSLAPSIFEYFRKQKNMTEDESYYILKYVSSLWLQSFHPEYGPDFWPATISSGSSDNDVLINTINIIETEQPQLLWVYLADVDHFGHSGIWNDYVASIENADYIVNTIWNKLQSEVHYMNNTTLFVTNDHGRHDDQHGGFQGHGCSCEGCRHIMFLALGPNIKENFISTQSYEIADVTVSGAEIINVDPEYATGILMEDIFKPTDIISKQKGFDLKISKHNIFFHTKKQSHITAEIYNIQGKLIESVVSSDFPEGDHKIGINKQLNNGLYILRIQSESAFETTKFIVF